MDVNSKYIVGDKEIGSGHYGVVRTCTSRGEQERMGQTVQTLYRYNATEPELYLIHDKSQMPRISYEANIVFL